MKPRSAGQLYVVAVENPFFCEKFSIETLSFHFQISVLIFYFGVCK